MWYKVCGVYNIFHWALGLWGSTMFRARQWFITLFSVLFCCVDMQHMVFICSSLMDKYIIPTSDVIHGLTLQSNKHNGWKSFFFKQPFKFFGNSPKDRQQMMKRVSKKIYWNSVGTIRANGVWATTCSSLLHPSSAGGNSIPRGWSPKHTASSPPSPKLRAMVSSQEGRLPADVFPGQLCAEAVDF